MTVSNSLEILCDQIFSVVWKMINMFPQVQTLEKSLSFSGEKSLLINRWHKQIMGTVELSLWNYNSQVFFSFSFHRKF